MEHTHTEMAGRGPVMRYAIAVALLIASMGLWLSAGAPGFAGTANQTQGVSLTVPSTISWGWGSVGTCSQSMPAYDFGSVGAGNTANSTIFTGCVRSNATWAVAASMTTAPSNGTSTVPASAFVGQVGTAPPTATTGCNAVNTTCTLDQSRTLFSGAPATGLDTGEQNAFTYKYALTVPAGQDSGAYTGGLVTFVASN